MKEERTRKENEDNCDKDQDHRVVYEHFRSPIAGEIQPDK
jgi:hypothetical protein